MWKFGYNLFVFFIFEDDVAAEEGVKKYTRCWLTCCA